MPNMIPLRIPTTLTQDEAFAYAVSVGSQIAKLSGRLLGTLTYTRNRQNQVTGVLLCFEEYSTGSPLRPSKYLLQMSLEDLFGTPSTHAEEHLRGKSLRKLTQAGIVQAGQLIMYYTTTDLLALPQFGQGSLEYVQKQLANYGHSVPDVLPD